MLGTILSRLNVGLKRDLLTHNERNTKHFLFIAISDDEPMLDEVAKEGIASLFNKTIK